MKSIAEAADASDRALISPRADFWLLGGASLVVWALAYFSRPWFPEGSRAPVLQVWAGVSALSLLVNHPHFLASYELAYRQGEAFILRHWPQLLAVPFLLLFAIAAALVRWNDFGPGTLGAVVAIMFATVGWHYAKQTWGCMAVTAHFDGYAVSRTQRRIVLGSVFAVWAANLAYGHVGGWVGEFMGLRVPVLGVPLWVARGLAGLALAGAVAVIVFVVLANRWRGGRWPSARFLVPWVAFYVWWLPWGFERRFYEIGVPFFHSLQYLPFVWRVEAARGRAEGGARPRLRLAMLAGGLVLAGWLAFVGVPRALDRVAFVEVAGVKLAFFAIAASAFINIHHYFIDNVIWRFGQPDVREHLLGAR